METVTLEGIDPSLREVVIKAAQLRCRAIDGVLALLKQTLHRRDVVPNVRQVRVDYQTETFVVLGYEGGFFAASFLYSETGESHHILVLEAEHVAPLMTGVVVTSGRQFIQRR